MALTRNQDSEYKQWKDWEVKVINDRAVRFSDVCVHEFTLGDVEDPEIYAGQPLWEWQQSEAGQWIMENAVAEPYWIKQTDYIMWGHKFKIMARLSEQNQSYWMLRWGRNNK